MTKFWHPVPLWTWVMLELFSDLIPEGERRAKKTSLSRPVWYTLLQRRVSPRNCHGVPRLGGLGHHHLSGLVCEWLPLCVLLHHTVFLFPPKGILASRRGCLPSPGVLPNGCPSPTVTRAPTQKQKLHSPSILLGILFELLFQLPGVLLLGAGPSPHGPSSRRRDRVGSLWPPQATFWPQSQQLTGSPQTCTGPGGVTQWDLGARDARGPIRDKDR